MYVDLPEFKRCCMCIPLRYGLLAWGYIKLIITILLLSLIVAILISHDDLTLSFITSLLFIAAVMEIALNIVFVIGAHRKNEKLLKVYLVYSIVAIILFSLLALVNFGFFIYLVFSTHQHSGFYIGVYYLFLMASVCATSVFQILLQFYLILLVRSEIRKLSNGHKFEFVNVAAEAVCKLKIAEEMTSPESIETMD